MNQEITLQALIEKVKADLMSAPLDPKNLLFFVEKVELELAVSITYEAQAGIKISLLNFLGSEIKGKAGTGEGHTIKVTLTPVLSIDEQRALLDRNPQLKRLAERASLEALWKSGENQLIGEPE